MALYMAVMAPTAPANSLAARETDSVVLGGAPCNWDNTPYLHNSGYAKLNRYKPCDNSKIWIPFNVFSISTYIHNLCQGKHFLSANMGYHRVYLRGAVGQT